MQVFVGTIETFGFPFAPRDWAQCNGQSQSIAQNEVLYALLGTTYGGDGVQTFNLPNLQGRFALHQGQGPGLTNRVIGEVAGSESVTLIQGQLPPHTHPWTSSSVAAAANAPTNTSLLGASNGADPGTGNAVTVNIYGPNTGGTATLSPGMVSWSGQNQPLDIAQPFLVTNTCISLYGIFPSRN